VAIHRVRTAAWREGGVAYAYVRDTIYSRQESNSNTAGITFRRTIFVHFYIIQGKRGERCVLKNTERDCQRFVRAVADRQDRQRERERERETHTETLAGAETDRQTDREAHRGD
jgi:hypothetical protein